MQSIKYKPAAIIGCWVCSLHHFPQNTEQLWFLAVSMSTVLCDVCLHGVKKNWTCQDLCILSGTCGIASFLRMDWRSTKKREGNTLALTPADTLALTPAATSQLST